MITPPSSEFLEAVRAYPKETKEVCWEDITTVCTVYHESNKVARYVNIMRDYLNAIPEIDGSQIDINLSWGPSKNEDRFCIDGQQWWTLALCEGHIKLLKKYRSQVPFLMTEDDTVPAYGLLPRFQVPVGAEGVYLGNTSYDPHLIQYTDQYSVCWHLLCSHAMLFLSTDWVDGCIEALEENMQNEKLVCDLVYASIQPYFRVFCLNEPMFFQLSPSTQVMTQQKANVKYDI